MSDRIFLGHTTKIVTASITRPADTTPYTAGDVIGTAATHVIELSSIARSNGGAGMIVTLDILDSASQATKPTLEAWIFSVAPAAQADNAPFAPTDAELAYLLGIVTPTTVIVGNATVGAGGNCVLPSGIVSRSFKCGVNVDDLYVVLVVRNAYTPVTAEVFSLVAAVLQDY